VTAKATASSIGRILRAFGSRYRYAPISNLYLVGRTQDTTFQKARAAIEERKHIRLWLAPVRHEDTPVWVGHISRDAGIKLSGRFWPPTTHVTPISPDDFRAVFFVDAVVPLDELEILDWSLPPELERFRESIFLPDTKRPSRGPWIRRPVRQR
jgi:hypothetical protein